MDRFHDGSPRAAVVGEGRSSGFSDPAWLRRFCGGTLVGITRNLDHIQDLGCTALWLSPLFENDGAPDPTSGSYHGYAIRNYLAVDQRFGTKRDLVELVEAAHARGLRVFLDAVANHAGDLFAYPGDDPYYYADDSRRYELGFWRHPDYPVPVELRDPACFHRRGQIRDGRWDSPPETQWGDFSSLKGFDNDESPAGLALQDVVIAAHRYWVREADIDGHRMDAVKHMGEQAVVASARPCASTRCLWASGTSSCSASWWPATPPSIAMRAPTPPGRAGDKTVFYGLDSVLDFPLYWTLPGVIRGERHPRDLINRYEALRDHALSRGWAATW